MRPASPKHLLLWLCLVGYLAAGVVGGQGLVLCVGPGGHVAIEANAAGDCDGCLPTPARGEADTPQRFFDTAPGCPCDDFAVPGTSLTARKQDSAASYDVESCAPMLVVALVATLESARIEFAAPDRFAAANRAQRTRSRSVVLLV